MAMLSTTIPAYLYTQYADDSDLQAFVAAYNTMSQWYVNTFVNLSLPIYTSDTISGALLDWVGQGIYGYPRPTLQSGRPIVLGPFNTFEFDQIPFNYELVTAATYAATSDDTYKRLLTWHFYKGDGKYFCIPWLKRRIMRFLLGVNGTAPNVGDTSSVSVTVSAGVFTIMLPALPASVILQEAIAAGVAELPFQYSYSVSVA